MFASLQSLINWGVNKSDYLIKELFLVYSSFLFYIFFYLAEMNPAENYIINQPEPYRSILLHLQILVESTLPEVELLYKYRIPFYYYKKRPFCFFNASHKRNYVDICFVRANQITIHKEHLVTEKRKIMGSLRYQTIEEVDEVILIELLNEVKQLY